MKPFRKILVATRDGHLSPGLLARASALARRSGATIRLVAAIDDLPWYTSLILPGAGEFQALLVRDREAALEALAGPIRQGGVDVSTAVVRGRRHVETVREVLRGGHDLLMKEAEPNEKVPFGSADMYLLRACPCPLWLALPGQGDRPIARILAAVDPAPPPDEADLLHLKEDPAPKDASLDAKVLEIAGSLAAADGAELHVLHAWSAPGEEILRGEAMLGQDQIDRYVDDSRTEARKALDLLLDKVPAPAGPRRAHLSKGDPADAIAECVRASGVDLLVMGTVARTGLPGLLMGNTAESILQRVDCSVLAIKPDGFVSPVRIDE